MQICYVIDIIGFYGFENSILCEIDFYADYLDNQSLILSGQLKYTASMVSSRSKCIFKLGGMKILTYLAELDLVSSGTR